MGRHSFALARSSVSIGAWLTLALACAFACIMRALVFCRIRACAPCLGAAKQYGTRRNVSDAGAWDSESVAGGFSESNDSRACARSKIEYKAQYTFHPRLNERSVQLAARARESDADEGASVTSSRAAREAQQREAANTFHPTIDRQSAVIAERAGRPANQPAAVRAESMFRRGSELAAKRTRARAERARELNQECTFQPVLRNRSPKQLHSFAERNEAWMAARTRKLARLGRARVRDDATAAPTFQPDLAGVHAERRTKGGEDEYSYDEDGDGDAGGGDKAADTRDSRKSSAAERQGAGTRSSARPSTGALRSGASETQANAGATHAPQLSGHMAYVRRMAAARALQAEKQQRLQGGPKGVPVKRNREGEVLAQPFSFAHRHSAADSTRDVRQRRKGRLVKAAELTHVPALRAPVEVTDMQRKNWLDLSPDVSAGAAQAANADETSGLRLALPNAAASDHSFSYEDEESQAS